MQFQETVSTRHAVQGGVQGLASDRGDRSDPLSAQSSSGLPANPRLLSEMGASDDRDAIVPEINVIRNNPNISDAVSKLGFYVPFNSQGHIGTGPQNCHLWDSNSQR